jgi:hypothetical protein
VKKFLYYENRNLKLFDSNGKYRKEMWKQFKKDYNITKPTKQLLITAPREDFFSVVKRPSAKNKNASKISPYAAEFFKVFLKSKGQYKKPEASAFLRPYDSSKDELSKWGDGDWDDYVNASIKLAIIDFRNIPGVLNKETAPSDAPYYTDFLEKLKKQSQPALTDPEAWLWICGGEEVDDDLRAEIRTGVMGQTYVPQYSQYKPAGVERLGDCAFNSNKARAAVHLIFLIKRGSRPKCRTIPKEFDVPNSTKWLKLGHYNELEYRLYNTELRMEFYLQVLDLFCITRQNVVSIFAGGKIVCAAWVRINYL